MKTSLARRMLLVAVCLSFAPACSTTPPEPETDTDLVLGGKADLPEGHANQFNFVTALYADILGRGAGNDEIESKVSAIESQGPQGVSLGMMLSDEYRSNLVTSYYQHYLDRDPDLDPQTGKVPHSDNGALVQGDPRDVLANAMLASDEFFALAGGTFEGFVDRAYNKVFGRSPSGGEIAQWNGKTRNQVAFALITSEEFHKQHLILDWFDNYLSRGPSSSERQQFHLMLSQMTHAQAQVAIVTSKEYMVGHGSCQITSCSSEGAECGQIADHCAGNLNCGTCPSGQTCGGDGVPNECGCNPLSCSAQSKNCGFTDDGCGNQLFCGSCPSGQICGGGGIPNICSGGPQETAPIRINSSSLLEVLHDGSWRGVCDDSFSTPDATVACRQLGGTLKSFQTAKTGPSAQFWLDEVGCSGSELAVSSCSHNPFGTEDCENNEWVQLSCDLGAGSDGDLRTTSGVLEVFHNSEWRGVCDDLFGQAEATVACRQLGGNLSSFSTGISGPSTSFWLDNVDCFGSELRLAQCTHNPFGTEDCGVTEHVSVVCSF